MAKENKAGHKEGGAGKKRKEPQHPEHKDKEHREEGKEHGEEHKHAHEERKPKEEHKEAQHEEHKPEEKYEEAHHERPPEEHREERKQEEGHVEHREERAREEEKGAAQESQIASGEKQEERHAPKEAGPEAEAVHEEEGRNVPQEAKAGGAYENEEDEERSIPWKSIAAIAIILIVVAAAALLLSQSMAPPPVYPTPLISVSSTVIDAGQAVVFNAMANGNYTPVSYDFVIVSAATGNALANVINANSMAYNSLAYTTNAAEAGNVLLGRVTVAYARGKAVSNESPGVTVNPRILAANVVTTASSISNGQAVSLTAGWSGGTPTYTLRWYVGQSASCAQDAVTLAVRANLSATSGSIALSPSGSTWYCYTVTDSSNTPATVASQAIEITVLTGRSTVGGTPGSNSTSQQQSTVFAISSVLCGLVGSVMGIVGALSLTLFLLGGVLYAVSHFLPTNLDFKKSLHTWSTTMIIGAVVALVVVIAAKPLLTLIANLGASATGASALSISC